MTSNATDPAARLRALVEQWRERADLENAAAERQQMYGSELYYSNGQAWMARRCADELDALLSEARVERPREDSMGDNASREVAKRMSVRGLSPYPLFQQDAAYLQNTRVEWDAVYLRAAGLRLLEAATAASRPAPAAEGWQPITDAHPDTEVLLYTPPEALYQRPRGRKADYRIAAPRFWTWATHWMPLPPPPTGDAT